MREPLTYASLVKKHGGRIIRSPHPMILTARLSVFRGSAPTTRSQFAGLAMAASGAATNRPDDNSHLHFRFLLTTSGANDNDQFFVDDELALPEIFQTPIGEPVNEDHEQTFHAICGEIYDSEYVSGNDVRPSCIVCKGVIFADEYPRVARKVKLGAGRWAAVSMEAMPRPLERVGKYLVIHNPKFTGVGLVRMPANPYSQIVEVNGSDPSNPIERHRDSQMSSKILSAGLDQAMGRNVNSGR